MFEVVSQEFTSAVRSLNRLSLILRDFELEHPELPRGATIPAAANAPVRTALHEFQIECVQIGADSSSEAAKKAIDTLRLPVTQAQMQATIGHVSQAFHKEAAAWYELVLHNAGSYLPSHKTIDAAALAKLPGIEDDLEEASRCVSAGRPAAAVFHLMRVMELAIRTWASALRIPRTRLNTGGTSLRERMWTDIVNELGDQICDLPDQSVADLGMKQAEQTILASLKQVGHSWHHPSMHPASKYTATQAATILEHVEEFLRLLAEVL
jgi:hypothetical protein